MSFANIASAYLTSHMLLSLAFGCAFVTNCVLGILDRRLSARLELVGHCLLLLSVMGLSVLHPLVPRPELFEPIAKVWVSPSAEHYRNMGPHESSAGVLSFPDFSSAGVRVESLSHMVVLGAFSLLILGFALLARDVKQLRLLRSRGFLIRKAGSVRIYVSDEVRVPFSYWVPGQRTVVMPESLLGGPWFRIALLHELQHHRQKDTQWVYFVWLLRVVFAPNPLIHIWARCLAESQEFACDEALLERRKVDSEAYASCLLHVAERALKLEPQPVCATGLMLGMGRKTLQRRITTMFEHKNRAGWELALPVGAVMVIALSLTAYASQGLVQDKRVSLQQAHELAARAQRRVEFPIVVNESVLKWLNFYLGTPDGREKTQEALIRLQNHRTVMEHKMAEHHAPQELLAVPFIEAGYRNLGHQQPLHQAAGLWQLMPATAKSYGLRVDSAVDQRLDVELCTDAAVRYLQANHLVFKDWQLSALAYNAGAALVLKTMTELGSRDPWVLVNSGRLPKETAEYLPRLMAALIIIQNPSVL